MSSAVVRSHTEGAAEQPTIFLFTDLTTDTPSSTFLFADFTTAKVDAWRRYKSRMHMRRTAANRPPTSFNSTQQTRMRTGTSPKAASTKEGRPFPGHEMLDIRRPDPCIAQCKLLYRSALFIVNAVMFALDRTLLGGQTRWIIVNACIIALASASQASAASESGADWVADMQRSVLMLIAAFILTDTVMVATTGPELHQRAVRMDNEELAVVRWAPRKEL